MKKIILTVSAVLLGIVVTSGVLAAAEPGSQTQGMMQEEQTGAMMQSSAGMTAESTGKFIGNRVDNAQGDEIGTISKLIVDDTTGQIGYAIVKSSGMGGEHYIVPWNALSQRPQTEKFILHISQDKLKEAPTGDTVADREEGMKIHQFYGVAPYWEESLEPKELMEKNE